MQGRRTRSAQLSDRRRGSTDYRSKRSAVRAIRRCPSPRKASDMAPAPARSGRSRGNKDQPGAAWSLSGHRPSCAESGGRHAARHDHRSGGHVGDVDDSFMRTEHGAMQRAQQLEKLYRACRAGIGLSVISMNDNAISGRAAARVDVIGGDGDRAESMRTRRHRPRRPAISYVGILRRVV